MTRTQYNSLPKLDLVWLTDMQEMTDELKATFESVERERQPDPDMDIVMKDLTAKAKARMEGLKDLKDWSNPDFLEYSYWAYMEEMEKLTAIAHMDVQNAKQREQRAEAMYRATALYGWLKAVEDRIEELGGKIEV